MDSCSLAGMHSGLLWGLYYNVGGFPALPDDANTALGMRVECLGTWGRASCPQYWSGGNLQIQDRKANFSGDLH